MLIKLQRSQNSPKNNLEINEEILIKERLLPPGLTHKIITNLGLKEENYWKLFVDLRMI